MGIEYIHVGFMKPVKVKLDGKLIGEIRPVSEGWQYFAKGSKHGGEIFEKLQQVKNSLEQD